jgi:3'-phosphoadenosine 5'-phosphosulfate sulfotransferase (PAPS reductase)/FAD synthetase
MASTRSSAAAPLGKKQGIADPTVWEATRARAREVWPDDRLEQLIEQTVDEIRKHTAGLRVGYGWSGGKDSVALRYVVERAGVTECVLGISNLEFPAFLQWVTDNMPDGLTVISTGQNLAWLARNPRMLFPQGSYGPRWFKLINHTAQARYFQQQALDVILLGRRRSDGNWCGPARATGQPPIYRNREGITRYSPLADWSHEAVFALIDRENLPLPPCYGWPRGYQIGTGAWPARQWTTSVGHGFEEVWQIDADVVRQAAPVLPQAAQWMRETGRA